MREPAVNVALPPTFQIVRKLRQRSEIADQETIPPVKQNIAKHLKAIFAGGELVPKSVVNYWLTTAADGKKYRAVHYSLNAILPVGNRVRSPLKPRSSRWTTRSMSSENRLISPKTLDSAVLPLKSSLGCPSGSWL